MTNQSPARMLVVVILGVLLTATPAGGTPPGRNGLIAFTTVEEGDEDTLAEIELIRPDGRRPRSLIVGANPSFSPDGRHIAYETNDEYSYGIALTGLHGRKTRRITRGADYSPSFAPSGKRLAFTRWPNYPNASPRGPAVHIYRAGRTRRLTPGLDPDWSTGGLIALERTDGIYVVRPATPRARRLIKGGRDPSWSPNGLELAFSSRGGDIGVKTLGRDRIRWITRGARFDTEPVFSPDGTTIAYRAGNDVGFGEDDGQLTVLGVDRQTLRRLRSWATVGAGIAWQPRH